VKSIHKEKHEDWLVKVTGRTANPAVKLQHRCNFGSTRPLVLQHAVHSWRSQRM